MYGTYVLVNVKFMDHLLFLLSGTAQKILTVNMLIAR